MKAEEIKQQLGELIADVSEENFRKGYDPISDLINDIEYCIDFNPIQEEEYERRIEDYYIDSASHDIQVEMERWIYRCSLREKMAPHIFEQYFEPFFNSTLKEVYDSKLTEELKIYVPKFDEWVFMILATMTEFYFREKYPFDDKNGKGFNLKVNLEDNESKSVLKYNAIPW